MVRKEDSHQKLEGRILGRHILIEIQIHHEEAPQNVNQICQMKKYKQLGKRSNHFSGNCFFQNLIKEKTMMIKYLEIKQILLKI